MYEYVGRMGERCMWQQTPGADDTVHAADRGLMAPAMGSNPEVSRHRGAMILAQPHPLIT